MGKNKEKEKRERRRQSGLSNVGRPRKKTSTKVLISMALARNAKKQKRNEHAVTMDLDNDDWDDIHPDVVGKLHHEEIKSDCTNKRGRERTEWECRIFVQIIAGISYSEKITPNEAIGKVHDWC